MTNKNIHQALIDNANRVRNYDFTHLNTPNTAVRKLNGTKMTIKRPSRNRSALLFNM